MAQKTAEFSSPVVLASDQPAFEVSQPGLSGGVRQTSVELTLANTAYPLPAVALANRAGISAQASPYNTTYIHVGGATVTATTETGVHAVTDGQAYAPGASIPIDLDTSVVLYACSSLAMQHVLVLEIAS